MVVKILQGNVYTSFPYVFLNSKQAKSLGVLFKKKPKNQAFGKKKFYNSFLKTAFQMHLYKNMLGLFCMCAFGVECPYSPG